MQIRIEPDWNVNRNAESYFRELNSIRIEPDWNVNHEVAIYEGGNKTLEQNQIGM